MTGGGPPTKATKSTTAADGGPKKRVSLPLLAPRTKQPETLLQRADLGLDDGGGGPVSHAGGGERSPLAWVGLGAVSVFVVLLPLAMLVMLIVRWATGGATVASAWGRGATLAAFVAAPMLSSVAGGYLVGRFGGRAGAREGALAGVVAGLVMWALSRTPLGFVIIFATGPAAWVGAWVGARGRSQGVRE